MVRCYMGRNRLVCLSMGNDTGMKIKPEQYELYAQCIRSDQISAADLVRLFKENPDFKRWYYESH